MASSSSSSSAPYPFTFTYPAPWQQPSQDDNLCPECSKLNLDRHFSAAFALYESTRRGKYRRPFEAARKGDGPVYLTNVYHVASLGDRLSFPLVCIRCKLCTFLRRLTPRPERGTYKLLAFCSSESYLFERPKKDGRAKLERRPWDQVEHNVFMAVVPEVRLVPKTGVPLRWLETEMPKAGAIYRLTAPEPGVDRIILPRELRSHADFALMRAWLARCRCQHKRCAPKKPLGLVLPGFRVIDCWKPKDKEGYDVILRSWSKPYVALSYVWGPPSGDWPQTILDAVEVTKRLGERYLWVDRLCIDQSNLEEKMILIGKMDAIYEGAEFTITNAAGDARTGLPGVSTTPRKPQLRVELSIGSEKVRGKTAVRDAPDKIRNMIGISEEEYDADTAGQTPWLEPSQFGLRDRMALDFGKHLEDRRLRDKYGLPKEHLDFFEYMAESYKWKSLEQFMDEKMTALAASIGIELKELYPHLVGELAEKEGIDTSNGLPKVDNYVPITPSEKPERPLPPIQEEEKLILVSTMEEPRTTIRNSEWATRGWTYQEGVLSNRRLVFTQEQVYWECGSMAVCESLKLPLNLLRTQTADGEQMADYMLSGIFDDDLHSASELQYGFQKPDNEDLGEQILMLDAHIQAFTARNLSFEGDSLNAFLGVAARYTTDAGLCLVLGLPVWVGAFANETPGLQHSFALSISSWTHITPKPAQESDLGLYTANCPRRRQFPSWTWAGWEGGVQFCNEKQPKFHRTEQTHNFPGTLTVIPESAGKVDGDIFETTGSDPSHSDYFKALTSRDWVGSVDKIWSAEMLVHNADGAESMLMSDWAPVCDIDQLKTWLLTIRKPLVLRHLCLTYANVEGGKLRVTEEEVKIHLSIPMTEEELVTGSVDGGVVAVLVFAGTVPFVWNGIARFLVLRRVIGDEDGGWERIGRMNMWVSEKKMRDFVDGGAMIGGVPVKRFGEDITIV